MIFRLLPTLLRIGVLVTITVSSGYASSFVTVKGHKLYREKKPYYFVGTNYWYGSFLGLEKDKKRGVERLKRELDLLKANGVTNLRLLAGAEGSGLLNGVTRVGPPLQPEQGRFDESILNGLDLVLYEMGKRGMTAVIFFSNNWEWSGGFQQYLIWNGVVSDKWLAAKPSWDELRDIVSRFYDCEPCKDGYTRQVKLVLNRKNRYTGKPYISDPTIMAWELANEPRPMRPVANEKYKLWASDTAAMIRSIDKNHLITTGHEGWIGTQDIKLFESIHANKNIDYLTIHIWPKNWGWFGDKRMAEDFPKAVSETEKYIAENLAVAVKLNKPLVIEEFGMPRDAQSFSIGSTTVIRDEYYKKIFSFIGHLPGGKPQIAGANFWAFGGTARPIDGQPFWKSGDEVMGDPPMEEQGLNSVFDSDRTTWEVIRSAGRKAAKGSR